MKSIIISIRAAVLFVVGLVVSFLMGTVVGAIGMAWMGLQNEKKAEEKEEPSESFRYKPDDVKLVMVKYDDRSKNWTPDMEVNIMLVRTVHKYLLDSLKARGHVFLNDALDQLGLPRTPFGQRAGWLITDERRSFDPSFSLWTEKIGSNEIILDLNIDGEIWEKI